MTTASENHSGLVVGNSSSSSGGVAGGLWSPLDGVGSAGNSNGTAAGGVGGGGSRYVWSDKPYSTAMGSGRNNNNNNSASKLLNLDMMMEDDEKDIENGMLEISKKLATELVDDDFAT